MYSGLKSMLCKTWGEKIWLDRRKHNAKAINPKKDNIIDGFAINRNLYLPELDSQSSTQKIADEEADMRKYVNTCNIKRSALSSP